MAEVIYRFSLKGSRGHFRTVGERIEFVIHPSLLHEFVDSVSKARSTDALSTYGISFRQTYDIRLTSISIIYHAATSYIQEGFLTEHLTKLDYLGGRTLFLDFSNSPNITNLGLYNNVLNSSAFEEIGRLPHLERLYISKCELDIVHITNTTLRSLRIIGMEMAGYNEFPTLPDSLEELYIEMLDPVYVPADITRLTRLTTLSLYRCALPESISAIASLERLYLCDCPVGYPILTAMTQLRELTARECNLEGVFPALHAPYMTYLDISDNRITGVEAFSGIPKLCDLIITYNPISILPIEQLPHLQELRMDETHIELSELMPRIPTGLRRLEARCNSILDMTHLRALATVSLNATDLPVGRFNITENITSLTLHGMHFSSSEFQLLCDCKFLHLELEYAELRDVSPVIRMTTLETLSLDNNLIEQLPQLTALTRLTQLSVANNRLLTIPYMSNTVLKVDVTGNKHLAYVPCRILTHALVKTDHRGGMEVEQPVIYYTICTLQEIAAEAVSRYMHIGVERFAYSRMLGEQAPEEQASEEQASQLVYQVIEALPQTPPALCDICGRFVYDVALAVASGIIRDTVFPIGSLACRTCRTLCKSKNSIYET